MGVVSASGPDGDAPVEVECGRAVQVVGPRQPVQRPAQELGVLRIETQPGGGGRGVGDGLLGPGEAGVGPDRQPGRPVAGADRDVTVGPADPDRPVAGQRAGGEQRGAADEQVAVPGEAEAPLDQDLPAVGGDDLAGDALELEAVQGVPGRALLGRRSGLGQRIGWVRPRNNVDFERLLW
jgi:hypothetical protein